MSRSAVRIVREVFVMQNGSLHQWIAADRRVRACLYSDSFQLL